MPEETSAVFASATMTAIDLARQFTDALIENDLAEEVPKFKKTFKDSNDNELRQVVDLGDGKIQIQFETTESTVGDISLKDAGRKRYGYDKYSRSFHGYHFYFSRI